MPIWFRFIYSSLWLLALPVVLLRLLVRGLRTSAYWRHWFERLSLSVATRNVDVWIHSVSVGETRAAAPLIRHFTAQGNTVLLTCSTPTGRATAKALFGAQVKLQFLPFDAPWLLARFFQQTRPRLGLLMETELWPGVCDGARRMGIPLWLVNARLSKRSAQGYAYGRSLSQAMLSCLTGIAAQTEAHAQRFRELGATNVHVTGNLKFDLSIPDDIDKKMTVLAQHLSRNRPFWVFGSSRGDEEALLLEALTKHPLRQRAVAVIVPRHPERWDEVMAIATHKAYRSTFRNATVIAPDIEVVIGNSMGEMLGYYGRAVAVVMGGTFGDTGGQNLIEPCALGVPVVLGPSVFNFQQAADEAISLGAAVAVSSPQHALDAVLRWLDHAETRNSASRAAQDFVNAHRGATIRTLTLLNCI